MQAKRNRTSINILKILSEDGDLNFRRSSKNDSVFGKIVEER
jgi:hypothetical protein